MIELFGICSGVTGLIPALACFVRMNNSVNQLMWMTYFTTINLPRVIRNEWVTGNVWVNGWLWKSALIQQSSIHTVSHSKWTWERMDPFRRQMFPQTDVTHRGTSYWSTVKGKRSMTKNMSLPPLPRRVWLPGHEPIYQHDHVFCAPHTLSGWAVSYLFWGHASHSSTVVCGNICLVAGSILSDVHFEWLTVEWVHSF